MNDWEATASKLGRVGRSTVFALWASGDLASVKIGRRRFSTDAQIADYIERLESEARGPGGTAA
ncbi:hypothetical protein C0J29_27045 [Mycobacterium paragordonae]|uniref:DNA-binding protein n=1 Tax=Mycobacterium paragordonae TaxID=1389713 RepID=A0ABQ1CBC9_9MYCO|nr:hypothetical protein [Mycobacterium paragordonae]AYE97906.1 hypothetical protein C0J29_27045 [Mycobacterium paragordonae]GFG81652.1 hypothetical protein MPRG_49280 [Mycobacterium paragordonae]